jgi:hypothetical protein
MHHSTARPAGTNVTLIPVEAASPRASRDLHSDSARLCTPGKVANDCAVLDLLDEPAGSRMFHELKSLGPGVRGCALSGPCNSGLAPVYGGESSAITGSATTEVVVHPHKIRAVLHPLPPPAHSRGKIITHLCHSLSLHQQTRH